MDFSKASGYFKYLVAKAEPYGYEPNRLINTIWAGTEAMVKNDGSKSNEDAFWEIFAGVYGEKSLSDKHIFDEFYQNEFQNAKIFCDSNPQAAEAVRKVKELGLRTALATNPIFPTTATESRIRWAGLILEDFELYTTYENTCYCKPNPDYY